ncbi:MAG: acylphosphatase [Gemmatimonadaceae bacterium]
MHSIHLEIRGRVQGVGFRWYVREKAREFRLTGWVKNKSDGNVEIAAFGEPAPLQAFKSAVTKGPAGAKVATVIELPPIPPDSVTTSFDITR